VRTPDLLSDPVYHDEDAARAYVEEIRWPDGPFCPFCGAFDTVKPLGGPSTGSGWYYCSACQDKFTVRVGSIFERSHIPLHEWLLAFRLMSSSKKGVLANQIHRTLGITYKSAWFLLHRIREAIRMMAHRWVAKARPSRAMRLFMAAKRTLPIRGISTMSAAGAKSAWPTVARSRSLPWSSVVQSPIGQGQKCHRERGPQGRARKCRHGKFADDRSGAHVSPHRNAIRQP
jgi:transposase-like protein